MTTAGCEVRENGALARALRYISFAKARGLDVRLSEDGARIEFFSSLTGRRLSSSPIEDFA